MGHELAYPGQPPQPTIMALTTSWPGDPAFPLLALVVSGAHSELVYIPRHGRYELLGQTRDDAAGEAFDKVGRCWGWATPADPPSNARRDSCAAGEPNPLRLPRAWLPGTVRLQFQRPEDGRAGTDGGRASGAQLAARAPARVATPARERTPRAGRHSRSPLVAAAFQEAVVDVLATKTSTCRARAGRAPGGAGGRRRGQWRAARTADCMLLARDGIALRYPPVALCTDNAAMIGAAAYFHLRLGERNGLDLDVRPNLRLPLPRTERRRTPSELPPSEAGRRTPMRATSSGPCPRRNECDKI